MEYEFLIRELTVNYVAKTFGVRETESLGSFTRLRLGDFDTALSGSETSSAWMIIHMGNNYVSCDHACLSVWSWRERDVEVELRPTIAEL